MSVKCMIPLNSPGVVRVKKKIVVQIDPHFEYVTRDAVMEHLWGRRKHFLQELGGVLLDWEIHKIKLKDKVPSPFLREAQVKGLFTVFQPAESTRLQGRVLERRSNLIIAVTYDLFCVKIIGSELRVTPGDEIEYTYQNYSCAEYKRNLAIISGSDPVLLNSRDVTDSLMETTDDERSEQARMSSSNQNGASFSPFLAPKPPSTPKSTSIQKKPSTLKPSLSPTKPSTPQSSAEDMSGSKRKSSSDTDADSRKKVKSSVESKFGNLSEIVPLPANTEPQEKQGDGSMEPANGLPDGWIRKRHATEKSSWYTYLSPAGKSFKNLKSAKASLEAVANDNLADSSAATVQAKRKQIVGAESKGELALVKKIIKEADDLKEEVEEENDETEKEEEEEVRSNGIEAAQMAESMFGDDDQESGQEITDEMRSSLLDNIQSKLNKSKKKKKKKNKEHDGSGF